MPKFSKISMQRLDTCHPDLQILFKTVILTFDCTVICGQRGQRQQEVAFTTGKSKLKWPNSKHNTTPSRAVDVVPYPIDWDNIKMFYWFGGYVLGIADMLYRDGKMQHKVRWGGDFDSDYNLTNNTGLIDLPHFELISA